MMRRAQLGWIAALIAVACGPTNSRTPGTNAPGDGGPGLVSIATPQGAPLAPATTVVVPTSGGTLSSADGAIRVTVPAGAVAEPTEFTITPIANTARGAVGPAYRLGPEGTTFRLPVLLTFKTPTQYPTGTSIEGVGVEYQDERGFWHRVEPVVRNAGAGTVAVTTTHFSDWAITWQTGEPAAEGPIILDQSVGIPFKAQGRATLFLQSDSAAQTVYLLTGTLTVPATIKMDGVDCTPDQVTKTLPLNVAEIVKGSPPVFRWGIGVTWTLSCPGPDNTVTTHLLPAMFDTMYINLTRCGGYYEAGQIVEPTHLKGAYTKNCGIEGSVSATWDLRTCVPDAACLVGTDCRLGVTSCTDGVATCVDSGPADNGTSCGPGDAFVCSETICVDPKDASTGIVIDPTAPLATAEPSGEAVFSVALATQPTTDVTIELSSSNAAEGIVTIAPAGGGTAPAVPGPVSLTFTPQNWNIPQNVTVIGQDDAVVDGEQGYTIVTAPAASGDPRYSGFNGPDVEVKNADDDVPGFTVTPEDGLVTTESGGQATFTIVMDTQPVADVTVPLAIADPTEGILSHGSVTFTPGNWNVPQTVTVTGVDDFVADGTEPFAVAAGPASSADPVYEGLDVPDVGLTNSDNDSPGITVSPTSGLFTQELGEGQTFTVVLNSEPTDVVRVPIASRNAAEGNASPAELVFTPLTWSIPQIVTVAGVEDFVDDGNQPYAVAVGPAITTDVRYLDLIGSDVGAVNEDNDATGVTLSRVEGLVTRESGAADTFTLRLASQPLADVTIALSSSRPEEGTVLPASVTFTPSNWSTEQTVTVSGAEDFLVDGNQPYAVVTALATSTDPTYNGFDAPDVSVTNEDDDSVGIIVTPTSALQTTEAGAGTATFTVVLRSQPFADVTVPIASSDTTEGTVSTGSVTFNASNWNQPQTVTVTGADDAIADSTQTYTVAIQQATSTDLAYAVIDAADLTLTNTDNDAVGISVTPTSGLVTTEVGGTSTFTVALQSEPTADVTIALSSSVPTEGSVSPPSVTFTAANWNAAQTVTVNGVNDPFDDGDQGYTIATAAASSSDTGYNGLDAADVSVTNVDEDVAGVIVTVVDSTTGEGGGQATFTISLATPPRQSVSISISSSDTEEGTVSPASVVFGAEDASPKTVTITGANDGIVDGNVGYTVVTGATVSVDPAYSGLAVDDVSLTNADDDFAGVLVSPISGDTTEGGVQATFTISLATPPQADVSISIATGDPAEGAVSPATLTFPAFNGSARTVTVTGVNDSFDDGNVTFAVVTGPTVSTDPAYSGLEVADVSVTNLDDDVAEVVVSPISGNTTEAGGKATFTISLATPPRAQVSISVGSTDPTEGTVDVATVVFPLGDGSARTVTVTGANDFVDDGNVGYTIVTGNSESDDPAYSGRIVGDVAVTNEDDGDTAAVVVSPISNPTTEAGGTATFSVALATEPGDVVTIALSSNSPTEGDLPFGTSVTFTPADWFLAQQVTVRGVDDAVDDGDVEYAIVTDSSSSADPLYAALAVADVAVTNVDDDSAGIAVTPSEPLVTTEGGGQAFFTIALTSAPTSDVTVDLSSRDTTEGTVAPTSVTFNSGNWSTPQGVIVTGADDTEVDGDQQYAVAFGVSSADSLYGAVTLGDLTVSNTDDGEPVAGEP